MAPTSGASRRLASPARSIPVGQPSQFSLIQGGSVQDDGDPNKSYPGYTIPDELTTASNGYTPGVVAMANTRKADTGGAQFFINTGDNTQYFQPDIRRLRRGDLWSGCRAEDRGQGQDRVRHDHDKRVAHTGAYRDSEVAVAPLS